MITDHFEIYGSAGGIVEAWATDYIRYPEPHRPDWQKVLAAEIKTRCGSLHLRGVKLLHATFFGEKKDDADVENLVLYNIGSFGKASDNGIRFEHGAAVPIAPSGTRYPFCYRYELAAEHDGFGYWQPGQTLASFDWINLGELKGEKLAAPVWLALARACEVGQAAVPPSEFTPGNQFAVRVQIRLPGGQARTVGNMVKGIVDGLVSAFQAHTDMTVLGKVVPPLTLTIQAASPALDVGPAEVERHLREQQRGVLGEVPQLIRPHGGGGIAFAPDDHLCVAGELVRVDPPGDRHWAIRGDVVELSPQQHI
jgi:hypothetical protein